MRPRPFFQVLMRAQRSGFEMKKSNRNTLALGLVFLFLATAAHAETLEQAMVQAYNKSSTLQSARARLRAVDEQVPLAKSGARPTADFGATIGESASSFQHKSTTTYTPRQFGFTLSQPLYKGGSIDASIASAENTVQAERANLVNAEQTLFLNVAQSYYDVLRDQSVIKLTRKTEEVLSKELQAARDRLKVGEATKTDTSQAESRYAGAVADRIQAEGNLALSKATYERIVGTPPGELKDEQVKLALPASLDEVVDLALKNNPEVISAQYEMQAAEHDVDTAQGALMPQISLEASGSRGYDVSGSALGESSGSSILARLVMPIYHGGSDYAKTRAAKETASQKRIEVRSAMNGVRENAVRAWQTLNTSRATITSRRKQVEASQLAYEGVKQESEVGTRTILDRLNAESEALQAQVNLVQARRDQAVAMYDLKAAVGELTADKLALPTLIYDSTSHYDSVKNSWLGLGEPMDAAKTDADYNAKPAESVAPAAATSAPAATASDKAAKAPAATDTPPAAIENKADESWFDKMLGMEW